MMKLYPVLLQNGLVIDPSTKRHEVVDIAVDENGLVSEISKGISPDKALKTIDAEGRIVTPGLVDLHVHVFEHVTEVGINADEHCLRKGVTTVLDAGSSGAQTFPGFKRYVIDVSETRIRALLNISYMGMINQAIGELEDLRYADVKKAVRVCEANKDVIMGIKVRISKDHAGNNGTEGLKRALEAAEAVQRPLMLHIGNSEDPLSEILPLLRKGDVLTHSYTDRGNGILDKNGNVLPEAKEAMARGVIFDVGHGLGSFSFGVARQAMSQGVEPKTISSDLWSANVNGPVYDLATTASKFIHMGLDLDDVLRKVTSVPADFLGLLGTIGTLRVGSQADIAAFDDQTGEFEFVDSYGKKEIGDRRLAPVFSMKGGKIHLDRISTSSKPNHS